MIELKSQDQIENIRKASKILVDVLNLLKAHISDGIETKELDSIAYEEIKLRGAQPAFLGYRGFPSSICVSINEEIVHGIPSSRELEAGDIASIDIGVELDGFFSDAAVTVAVGEVGEDKQRLIDATRDSLYKGIEKAMPGFRVSDISYSIQEYVEKNNFSVIKEFVGHGIGLSLHEDPQIPNFGQGGMGARIKEGMVLAIEPMISAGNWESEILEDGWTAVTRDRSLAAHFEHTVAITAEGAQILTEGIM